MNTITVQLNDKQFDALQDLIPYAMDHLDHRISIEGDNGHQDDFKAELAMAGEVAEALNSTKSYLWISSHGEVDLDLPAEVVDSIAQQGDNEAACRDALENDDYVRAQLESFDAGNPGPIHAFLSETGLDWVDDMSPETRRLYVLWIACHDINEERNQED